MSMAPERSKALHNFTLPGELSWGNQRLLKCFKVNDATGEIISAVDRRPSSYRSNHRRENASTSFKVPKFPSRDNGIAAVREKLMLDLQTEADRMKESIFREGFVPEKEYTPSPARSPATVKAPAMPEGNGTERPWSLRTRRAACKIPTVVGGGSLSTAAVAGQGGFAKPTGLVLPWSAETKSPPRSRNSVGVSTAAAASPSGEKRERAKFSVSLSRTEIEEDFMAMCGHRPRRRPQKRPKIVQKELDALFPAFWLTEVTADDYKVPDTQ